GGGPVWEKYQRGEQRAFIKTDYQRIEAFLREQELEHGWQVVAGKHAGTPEKSFNGVRPSQGEYHRARRAVQAGQALDIGAEPFWPVKARARAVRDALFKAESLEAFDEVLAGRGLYLEAKGQGGVIRSGPGFQVKLSDVARELSAG